MVAQEAAWLTGITSRGRKAMIWLKLLVDALQILSILSAAGFAMLGLFTEFKKDGRITRHGRIAVFGVVLSAILSLATQAGKAALDREASKVADAKHQAELDNATERFSNQSEALSELLNEQDASLERSKALENALTDARDDQDQQSRQLMGRMDNSIAAIDESRAAQRVQATTLFRSIWYNANRIDASALRVRVDYSCNTRTGEPAPALLGSPVRADIAVRRARSLPGDGLGKLPFTSEIKISGSHFLSRTEETTRRAYGPSEKSQMYTGVYGPFWAGSGAKIDNPDDWRNAQVEIIVTAQLQISPEALLASLRPVSEPYDLGRFGPPVPRPGREVFDIQRLNCTTQMTLYANGRQLVHQSGGSLYLVGGKRPTVVAHSYGARIAAGALPEYEPMDVQ
jgi:hypothetical protein